MDYKDRTLTFEPDKIYYTSNDTQYEVMMDWEDTLMSASAAYACQNGGDILEIGFGMGISAGYIQSHQINSHTIIENHPQVIEELKIWAQDKPNVNIVTGSWYEVKNSLSTYDGVFYDTFGDNDMRHFSSSLASLVKQGGVATWWNNNPSKTNYYNISGVEYDQINITPPKNIYFNSDVYFLPKKQF